jgi:polyisoprenoid-binding protein YceI
MKRFRNRICLKILCSIPLLLASSFSWGAPISYRPVSTTTQKPLIRFTLPYSLGTHEGQTHLILGEIKLDLDHPEKATGSLRASISTLTSDSDKRDCHMREALGLNYDQSDFPKDHVCDDENQLPLTGKNSIAYPDIELKITSVKSHDPSGKIHREKETQIDVDGTWTIHGVTRTTRVPMKVIPEGGKFRIQGSAPFALSAYRIEVKPAQLVFVTIRVADQAMILFDILMEPNEAAK